MNEKEFRQLAGSLHYPEESAALIELAAAVPRHQAIVEIGSYVGGSALALAWGAANGHGAHVTCIDPWPLPRSSEPDREHATRQMLALQAFRNNMGAADWPVTALMARSHEILPMWLQPIGLLFIDGNHSFDSVIMDIAWTTHLAPGGRVALHDYHDLTSDKETAVAAAANHVIKHWTDSYIVQTMFVGTPVL